MPIIENEWDKAKLKSIMDHAKRSGSDEVFKRAFRQLCLAEGRSVNDPLASELAIALHALEAVRGTRASYTRRKLDRVGAYQTIVGLVMKPKPQEGFLKLVENGMADLTAEAI